MLNIANCQGKANQNHSEIPPNTTRIAIIYLLIFWLHCATCRIIIPRPGIEPVPSAVKAQSPNHWTAREFLGWLLLKKKTKTKTQKITSVGKDVQNGTFPHCWWEYKMVQSLWKAGWQLLRKRKRELPYDPAIPLLGIHPKQLKAGT